MVQHEPVAPREAGTEVGTGQAQLWDGQAGPWGQGWAKDRMGYHPASWVSWLGRAMAELERSSAAALWC